MFCATEEYLRNAVQVINEEFNQDHNEDIEIALKEFMEAFANNNSAWFDNVQHKENEAGLWELKDSGGAVADLKCA
eukprot:2775550-Rhodomonas_salina.1